MELFLKVPAVQNLAGPIRDILAFHPTPDEWRWALDSSCPEDMAAVFATLTAATEEGEPYFRWCSIEAWCENCMKDATDVMLNCNAMFLATAVRQDPSRWETVRRYIDQADRDLIIWEKFPRVANHSNVSQFIGGLGHDEARFFCRDMRCSPNDDIIRFLAGIDERYRCGFMHIIGNRIQVELV